jgi:hypothetical protein
LDARQDFVWKRVCVHKRGSGNFAPDVIHLND